MACRSHWTSFILKHKRIHSISIPAHFLIKPIICDQLRKQVTPKASKRTQVFQLHGVRRVDDFYYFKDPDDPEVRAYIQQENEYANAGLKIYDEIAQTIYQELWQRMLEEECSVPEIISGYRYYSKLLRRNAYPIHCRAISEDEGQGEEKIYLDENALAQGHDYFDLSTVSISPNCEYFAYAVDVVGDERYDLHLIRMCDGKTLLVMSAVGDDIAWSQDSDYLLYTELDTNSRPYAVSAYCLGTKTHSRLYREDHGAFYLSVWLSRSKEWIFIDTSSNTTSETLAIPAKHPLTKPIVISPRKQDVEYSVDHQGDRFLIITNDQADNFRLIEKKILTGDTTELIPERDSITLECIDAYASCIVIGEREQGKEYWWVWNLNIDEKIPIPIWDQGCSLDIEDLEDYETDFIRYEYRSWLSPHRVFDFYPDNSEIRIRKEDIPEGYSAADYRYEYYQVDLDGVWIPLTLLQNNQWAETVRPVLMLAYGAYEENLDPSFDSDLVSLMDRGVVIALAHVRGGGDLGPDWHDEGCLHNKENSFNDFIACAEFLIQRGIARTGHIAAWGASAGGLLVAVCAQRRPELFSAIIAEVPFVDVINTLLDEDLPLTEHDYEEFGNPKEYDDYQYISAYSPYDNVDAQVYPPMLVTAGLKDQRVGYWEALKWVAKLRQLKIDQNPLLLLIDEYGHLGESDRYQELRRTAVIYSFLLDTWGLEIPMNCKEK